MILNNNQIHLLEKQDNNCKETKPTHNISYLHFYNFCNIDYKYIYGSNKPKQDGHYITVFTQQERNPLF